MQLPAPLISPDGTQPRAPGVAFGRTVHTDSNDSTTKQRTGKRCAARGYPGPNVTVPSNSAVTVP
jgi:hypothetical protein